MWPTRHDRVCSVLLLLACTRALPDSDASLIADFTALHTPIYSVYAVGGDADALHDLLAGRFSGEALTREYVEHFLALHRLQEQQTTIEVTSVDYDGVSVLSRSGEQARLEADWSVAGTITHRDHSHTRTNRYAAIYTVAATGAGLRIVDTRLRDLERLTGRLSTGERGGLTPLELLGEEEEP